MQKEPVVFQGPDGATSIGAGDVARYSTAGRVTLAVLWVLGGLVCGTACIIIPVVHLVSTWALPLLGIFMAVRTMRREVVIYQPKGTCPSCGESIELHGGATSDASWQTCPNCKAQLELHPEEKTSEAAAEPEISETADAGRNAG